LIFFNNDLFDQRDIFQKVLNYWVWQFLNILFGQMTTLLWVFKQL